MYHGDIRLGDTIDMKFTTVNTSGVPTTLGSSPVISAYPANSTTELTAGITLSVDFDSRTGLNNVRVVATSNNGYVTATNYTLVITTGTVGTSVVGYCVGSFSIENRSALMPVTVGRTLVVDAAGLADANMVKMGATGAGTAQTARDIGTSVLLSSGTGTGQLKLASGYVAMTWADVAAPTTTVDLSGTTIATTQKVDVNTIKTNPVVNGGTITFPTNKTLADTTSAVGSVTGAVGSISNGGIVAATFAAGALDAAALATDAAQEIADALLARNVSGGSSTGRTVKQALHLLRNKVSIAAGTMTVTDTDDTTSSWTAAVTTAAGNPIDSVDPA